MSYTCARRRDGRPARLLSENVLRLHQISIRVSVAVSPQTCPAYSREFTFVELHDV